MASEPTFDAADFALFQKFMKFQAASKADQPEEALVLQRTAEDGGDSVASAPCTPAKKKMGRPKQETPVA